MLHKCDGLIRGRILKKNSNEHNWIGEAQCYHCNPWKYPRSMKDFFFAFSDSTVPSKAIEMRVFFLLNLLVTITVFASQQSFLSSNKFLFIMHSKFASWQFWQNNQKEWDHYAVGIGTRAKQCLGAGACLCVSESDKVAMALRMVLFRITPLILLKGK